MTDADPRDYFVGLQARIADALGAIEGAPLRRDEWTRPEGGGGISRMVEDGAVLERGGVLFSHVTGDKLPPSATAQRPELAGRAWEAMGVSLVLHPRNPYAPTVHLNVRHFVARKAGSEPLWWFGGGMDLTPYYGFAEDATPKTNGLAKPQATIVAKGKGKPPATCTIKVGEETKDKLNYYVMTGKGSEVYLAPKWNVDRVLVKLDDLKKSSTSSAGGPSPPVAAKPNPHQR